MYYSVLFWDRQNEVPQFAGADDVATISNAFHYLLILFVCWLFFLVFFGGLTQARTAYEHIKTVMAVVTAVSIIGTLILGKESLSLFSL